MKKRVLGCRWNGRMKRMDGGDETRDSLDKLDPADVEDTKLAPPSSPRTTTVAEVGQK